MISDYTLNTLLKSSIDLNWLESTQTLNGDAIGKYIHGFDESFGSFTDIEMTCQPVKGTQKLQVDELTQFSSLFNVRVQNPFTDKEMDALFMQIEMVSSVRLDISNEFKIIG